MLVLPDARQVAEMAASLGLTLSTDEIAVYQAVLGEQLQELDDLARSRLAEDRPNAMEMSGFGV